jgi:hypothetical protein
LKYKNQKSKNRAKELECSSETTITCTTISSVQANNHINQVSMSRLLP